MSSARAKAILAERRRRDQFPDAVAAVVASLFPLQRAFALSSAKRIENHAGRRSGKTNGAAARAFVEAEKHPGATIPVFERTLNCTAADTFWALLQEYDERFKLGCKFHHTYRRVDLPNRATIALLGADTLEAADKARGGKHPLVIVDEAGSYRSKVLSYLLTDVAEPAVTDFDGTIMVLGTPGLVPAGTWYDACHNAAWEHHHWTLLENPMLPLGRPDLDAAARLTWRQDYLAELRRRHGWTESTPIYAREYRGQWSSALEDRIYRYDASRNLIPDLPVSSRDVWTYALSMDLGFVHPTAFVVWGRRRGDPHKYVVESYEQEGLTPSDVAAHVQRLRHRYQFASIVADTGGYGKAVAVEMEQRHAIPVKAAQKRDKRVFIEHTNGDLENGRIKIVARANEALCEDLLTLGWDAEREDSAPNSRDHLPDAFLYGDREIRTWGLTTAEADPAEPGTPGWMAALEAQVERELDTRHALLRGRSDDDGWREKWYRESPDTW